MTATRMTSTCSPTQLVKHALGNVGPRLNVSLEQRHLRLASGEATIDTHARPHQHQRPRRLSDRELRPAIDSPLRPLQSFSRSPIQRRLARIALSTSRTHHVQAYPHPDHQAPSRDRPKHALMPTSPSRLRTRSPCQTTESAYPPPIGINRPEPTEPLRGGQGGCGDARPRDMSQAGFDGGFESRTICPRERRPSSDATSEEVPGGAVRARCAAGVRVGAADRARRG